MKKSVIVKIFYNLKVN